MSVEAIVWALNDAPLPPEEPGQPSRSALAFTLVALANHASPDGTAAFPSVRRLVSYTHLSERTIRACIRRLETCGLITPTNPAIVAAHIARADRRPQGWDLALHRTRDPEHLDPPGKTDGGQPLHPARGHEGQPLPPVEGHGVQPLPPRGAATAPEPSLNRTRSPDESQPPLPDMPGSRHGDRCPAHRDNRAGSARCHACAQARATAEEHIRSQAYAAAQARRAAINRCGLCDDDGYRGTQVCNHRDPGAGAEARRRAKEFLADRLRGDPRPGQPPSPD
ncbi:helix-turn-helix domain-containing protein [Crossiella sp. SN42]|uniref:helix-turn-helix domain-containing protein n=1 Tax=Crossiella sp. SN42 TaxID=2944808 RepID=UPI00207D08FA|nr:helix-turn-helix domain-containing protein [Crossiella sp. SN42]MCO1575474.1 helix-turn-helix domain-containing protein [Crossiella sp. SN42]